MSTEALARLAYNFPGLGKLLDERLPPKVIGIDGEGLGPLEKLACGRARRVGAAPTGL